MGRRAQQFFQQFEMDYIIGVQGENGWVTQDYLNDILEVGKVAVMDKVMEMAHTDTRLPSFSILILFCYILKTYKLYYISIVCILLELTANKKDELNKM